MSDQTCLHPESDQTGADLYRLVTELYPICRSITGKGFRDTMKNLQRIIPLEIHEVPTGTQVYDWTVPQEWNIDDAYVKNARGDRIIDFKQSNLHVLNYSVPIHRKMPLSELRAHLYSLPDYPDWIPYRTSYYTENWGFCLSHNELVRLVDGEYEVCIASTLAPGNLTYGEYVLPGIIEDEILISCHACHPSLCNDNLSGISVAAYLAKSLAGVSHRYSYRFLFIPGTIGSITWLALHEAQISHIKHGLVVACVGDPGKPHYKRSRNGKAEIDRTVEYVLEHSGQDFAIEDFTPYGYDERQYCSPGINLDVGCLSRTPYSRYPEYHTSADNLDLVQPVYLEDSLKLYQETVSIIEKNRAYINTSPKGEPQLGRRGLYGIFGGRKEADKAETALLWVLNFSDGCHDLLEIADKSGIAFRSIAEAAEVLASQGLLREP